MGSAPFVVYSSVVQLHLQLQVGLQFWLQLQVQQVQCSCSCSCSSSGSCRCSKLQHATRRHATPHQTRQTRLRWLRCTYHCHCHFHQHYTRRPLPVPLHLQLQLHYLRLQLHFTTLHRAPLQPYLRLQLKLEQQLQLQSLLQLQLRLPFTRLHQTTTTLHYDQNGSCNCKCTIQHCTRRSTTCARSRHDRDSELQPPIDPSVGCLCHPCVTTNHLSCKFPTFTCPIRFYL